MDIFEKLQSAAANRQLLFVIIGGHAVALHGYGRTTEDLDLLACKDWRDAWLELMASLGYTLRHDGHSFLQFDPPAGEEWAVDIMLVNQATFDQISLEALLRPLGKVKVHFASLRHLLALKLFVLKQRKSHRLLKDLDDVIMLIQRNQLDVRSAEFRALVEKYGDAELYEKIAHACG